MNNNGNDRERTRIPIRFEDDNGEPEAALTDSGGNLSSDDPILYPSEADARMNDEGQADEGLEIGYEPSDAGQSFDTETQRGTATVKDFGTDQNAGKGVKPAADPRPAPAAHDISHQAQPQAAGPVLAELIATRAELKRVEAENVDLRETLARRQADFDNFRKRGERERFESYNRVVGEVAGKLLPVVDNLRRALESETAASVGESDEFHHFLNGVQLIGRQLSEVLAGLGVQPMNSVGKPFDPHLHEAVATELSEEVEPDTVLQELVQGYVIGEKLLRAAVVKVSTR